MKNRGFTLLETLVAIGIMMIAIASAFGLAPEGLIGARFAKNQTTATYLAQEGLEIVHNLRDNAMLFSTNSSDPYNWLKNIEQCVDKRCTVNAVENKLDVCGNACPPVRSMRTLDGGIAYGNGGIFTTDSSAQDTIFTRYITVKKVFNETIGRDDTEAVVTAYVVWRENRTSKTTEVSDTIFDWYTFSK